MGLTASPLCQLSRASLRQMAAAAALRGVPPTTNCSENGLSSWPPPGPPCPPPGALPVPCFPLSQQAPQHPSSPGVRLVESLPEALCGLRLHPPSLQLGQERRSEHGNGAEDAGQDRTGSAA